MKMAEALSPLLRCMSDGLYCVDRDRKIMVWNAAAEEISGYRAQDILGYSCADNILKHTDHSGCNLCRGSCPMAGVIRSGWASEAEVMMHHIDGYRIPVRVRCNAIKDGAGQITGGVEVFSDSTAAAVYKRNAGLLAQMGMLDGLTRIPNGAFFDEMAENRAEEFANYGWPFALLLLDVDGLGRCNDRHGQEVGDMALRMVSQTLAHNAQGFDYVARLEGGTFACLLRNADQPLALKISNRLRALVEQSFFKVKGDIIATACSVGSTVTKHGDMLTGILERARKALSLSKKSGGNRASLV